MLLSPDVWLRRGDERHGEHGRQRSKPRQDRHGGHHRPRGQQGQEPCPIWYDESGSPMPFMFPDAQGTVVGGTTWTLDGGAMAG
jgi:hypothetical protein